MRLLVSSAVRRVGAAGCMVIFLVLAAAGTALAGPYTVVTALTPDSARVIPEVVLDVPEARAQADQRTPLTLALAPEGGAQLTYVFDAGTLRGGGGAAAFTLTGSHDSLRSVVNAGDQLHQLKCFAKSGHVVLVSASRVEQAGINAAIGTAVGDVDCSFGVGSTLKWRGLEGKAEAFEDRTDVFRVKFADWDIDNLVLNQFGVPIGWYVAGSNFPAKYSSLDALASDPVIDAKKGAASCKVDFTVFSQFASRFGENQVGFTDFKKIEKAFGSDC